MSQTAPLTFEVTRRTDPRPDAERDAVLADPKFGTTFTDHMVTATWREGEGWAGGKVTAYGPITIMPSAAVLHYAQEIFEGMKAYRHEDGTVWTFRPEANAQRMIRSARRMTLPALPEDDFIASLRALVEVDHAWVPAADGEKSLYLRPYMYASEAFLGVRPAREVTYSVIASPAGAYFAGGNKPVTLCGEMAGWPRCFIPLLGMGLRRWSMSPPGSAAARPTLLTRSIQRWSSSAGHSSCRPGCSARFAAKGPP